MTSYIPEQYQDIFDINLNKVNTIFEPRTYPPSEKEADELLGWIQQELSKTNHLQDILYLSEYSDETEENAPRLSFRTLFKKLYIQLRGNKKEDKETNQEKEE